MLTCSLFKDKPRDDEVKPIIVNVSLRYQLDSGIAGTLV